MYRLFPLFLLIGALSACKERPSDVDFPRDDNDTAELPEADGTEAAPYVIPVFENRATYRDERSTADALSDVYDVYPPHEQDESGPENLYVFTVTERVIVHARLAYPEADGVDNDIHLLADFDPESVIDRDHYDILQTLEAGEYVLSVDTFVSGGVEKSGPYTLLVDIQPWHAGTLDDPIPLGSAYGGTATLPIRYVDTRDTSDSPSREIDVYPPSSADESGPEVVYWFRVDEPVRVTADLKGPEPEGVDIDLHLLSSISPVTLVERGNGQFHTVLDPGEYWIVADTFVSGAAEMAGAYTMSVHIRTPEYNPADFFNETILEAVELLYAEYGLLGYDSAVLTHDIPYGETGLIEATKGAKTMCVGGMLEVILVAMQLYEEQTGDSSVWTFLPERSFERLGAGDLKAHLWVNYDLYAGGSADALRHFGMGENIGFKHLMPGGFINLNRTSGTGHAVVFISYLDIDGNEYDVWHPDVVGFKYFSAQGGYDEGAGGLDYRYAVFSEFGKPTMPYKRDSGIIYREENGQNYLNTGMMYHPSLWLETPFSAETATVPTGWEEDVSVFDAEYFDGVAF